MSDNDDVTQRAARTMHDAECGCDDYLDDHVITEDAVGAPNSYIERARAVAAAGLLATTSDTPPGLPFDARMDLERTVRQAMERGAAAEGIAHAVMRLIAPWVASAGGEDNGAGSDRTAAHSEADRDGEGALERMADAIRIECLLGSCAPWSSLSKGTRAKWIDTARAALAALRGEAAVTNKVSTEDGTKVWVTVEEPDDGGRIELLIDQPGDDGDTALAVLSATEARVLAASLLAAAGEAGR